MPGDQYGVESSGGRLSRQAGLPYVVNVIQMNFHCPHPRSWRLIVEETDSYELKKAFKHKAAPVPTHPF